MALIRLDNASLAYGDHALLDEMSLAVQANERLAIVGRNGMGKSTLMRVLSGTENLDSGVYNVGNDVVVTYLPQALPPADETTVFDYLAQGLSDIGKLLAEYDHLAANAMDEKSLQKLERIQEAIEINDGWALQQRIQAAITDLQLQADTKMQALSGGWRKRVAIARALLNSPDVLLLDEPTNHLDIPAMQWLQKQLANLSCSLLLISHDRRFLDEVVDGILWLDRGKLHRFDMDYADFLQAKEEHLAIEQQQQALFDKRLAEEEVWIRQGIKARRTRNEGRVRALKALRKERAARVNVKGNVKMTLDDRQASGKRIAELENVSFAYQGKTIINNANVLVQRGDRVGLIGRNGAGKSTLIKLILGQLTPDEGKITLGTNQQVAYFDQTRAQLDDDATVADSVGGGRDSIEINGKTKHVMSYLADFLFTAQRARSPVSTLSGGEKNRLLLAKLFSQPANILILDEPTNDLDIETLELLEELLDAFKGTVIIASHDRQFVDNIVTSTLFVDDTGHVHEHVGGFDDLQRQYGELWAQVSFVEKEEPVAKTEPQVVEQKTAQKPSAKKLSYKLQRELDELPQKIEDLENQIAALENVMSEPDFYQQDHQDVAKATQDLSDLQAQLEHCYERWQELDGE